MFTMKFNAIRNKVVRPMGPARVLMQHWRRRSPLTPLLSPLLVSSLRAAHGGCAGRPRLKKKHQGQISTPMNAPRVTAELTLLTKTNVYFSPEAISLAGMHGESCTTAHSEAFDFERTKGICERKLETEIDKTTQHPDWIYSWLYVDLQEYELTNKLKYGLESKKHYKRSLPSTADRVQKIRDKLAYLQTQTVSIAPSSFLFKFPAIFLTCSSLSLFGLFLNL
jgi:hypothetical protein